MPLFIVKKEHVTAGASVSLRDVFTISEQLIAAASVAASR